MPSHSLLHALEGVVGMLINQFVMKLQHGRMELCHDHVLVITLVADERPFGSFVDGIIESGQVPCLAGFFVFEQRAPKSKLLPKIHPWLVSGPTAVQRIQVQPRSAEIDQRIRIVLLLQARRGVERDIVINELTEVRIAGGDSHVLFVILNALVVCLKCGDGRILVGVQVLRVRSHGQPQIEKRLLGPLGGWQGPKHPSEASFELRRSQNGVVAPDAASVSSGLTFFCTDSRVDHQFLLKEPTRRRPTFIDRCFGLSVKASQNLETKSGDRRTLSIVC